jgi:hypothetical protein
MPVMRKKRSLEALFGIAESRKGKEREKRMKGRTVVHGLGVLEQRPDVF